MSIDLLKSKVCKIIQACDYGLLIGISFDKNPLTDVAFHLNKIVIENLEAINGTIHFPSLTPEDSIFSQPPECRLFTQMNKLNECELPSIQRFLLDYMEKSRPLKVLGLTNAWPAIKKWDFDYFRIIGGYRIIPIEVGRRYTDSDWSQSLMTFNQYLECCQNDYSLPNESKCVYLAQHQLFDQIPELLSDFFVPDYCLTGNERPVLNAWIGPKGTITPLHYDPDHNILVQVNIFFYSA